MVRETLAGPLVPIILSTFNNEATIGTCLASLRKQKIRKEKID